MRELFLQSRWLLVAALAAVLVAFGISWLDSPEIARDPLAAAPAGSSIVMRVDVDALTSSHAWRLLLEEDRQADGGVRRIERACGYDPLEQVDEAFVFVAGTDARAFSEVGLIARGEMARGASNRQRLLECVGKVVEGRGALERVQVEGEPAIASSGGSHAAFLGGDGVVAGDRPMVARTIRVARGDAPSASGDATLRRLWDRVSADRDLVAVARLPERWMPALRRMAGRFGGELEALASVRALGVGVRVRGGLSIGLAAWTADAAGASALEQALRSRVDALLARPLVGLSTLGRVLRRVQTEASDRELVLTASITNDQLDDLLALWRELRATSSETPSDAVPSSDAGLPPTE